MPASAPQLGSPVREALDLRATMLTLKPGSANPWDAPGRPAAPLARIGMLGEPRNQRSDVERSGLDLQQLESHEKGKQRKILIICGVATWLAVEWRGAGQSLFAGLLFQ